MQPPATTFIKTMTSGNGDQRRRLGLAQKVALILLACLGVIALTLWLAVRQSVANGVQLIMEERQAFAINAAIAVLEVGSGRLKVQRSADRRVERLEVAEMHEVGSDNTAVAISNAVGASATVFTWLPDRNQFERTWTTIRTADGTSLKGTFLELSNPTHGRLQRGEKWAGDIMVGGRPYLAVAIPIHSTENRVIGGLGIALPRATVDLAASDIEHTIVQVAVPLLILATTVLLFVFRRIVGRLLALVATTSTFAKGDLSGFVPRQSDKDEIGDLAKALAGFRENLVERRSLRAQQDTDAAARIQRQAVVDGLIADFKESVASILGSVSRHVERSRASAQQLSAATDQSESQTQHVAAASQQISATTVQVAAAVDELAAGVGELASQTSAAFTKVDAMAKAADQATETIMRLSLAAERIGSVTGLIKGVADQTALLSLNATIEAARAGEAGKGFAVVALEVKGLANQTTHATEDIGRLVASMQAETESAVASMRELAASALEAQSATSAISAALQQQDAVSSEIARSVNETSRSTSELTNNIAGVSSVVNEAAKASSEALRNSDDLAANAVRLHEAVDRFLSDVQAA
jgi:methyl-accepting chemotaxis protein